jgi:redox-sensitive bicupin YhaK (pirin superfamily)
MLARKLEATREIVYRTKGRASGPITRLMSPGDLGEVVKPFVFLDLAVFGEGPRMSMDEFWHPHSGIATITVMLDGGMKFAETTGRRGELSRGGVEFMRAGNGVWHTGEALPEATRLFQLWIALPRNLENGPHASQYLTAADVPAQGPVRVILGEYDGMKSPIDAPPMTYLQVSLRDGERWTYVPAADHDVAWLAVADGKLDTVDTGELAVFDYGNQPIDVVAHGDTRFVIGSAPLHPEDLVLGTYSVHSSEQTLYRGEQEIRRIGEQLRAEGVLKRRF